MKPDEREFSERVGKKAARKRRARRTGAASIWSGLGLFGLVGWSVVIPTLLGLALGMWIDTTWPSRLSWTLMLLLVGVIIGSLNAWFWVAQERRAIEREGAEEQEDNG